MRKKSKNYAAVNYKVLEELENLRKHDDSLDARYENPALGHPLYTYGDVLQFEVGPLKDWNGNLVREREMVEGVVEIVDAYGTFEQDEEPSYDLYSKERKMLYKHIRESEIIKKVRVAAQDERMR